jgi:hypothetical protein
VLAEQIDTCASAAAAARTRKSQSLPGLSPIPSQLASANTSTLPTASKEPPQISPRLPMA